MFKNEIKIFLTAVLFYTRIPCPKWVDHSSEYLNKSTRYFPLIGWIVGAFCYIVYYGTKQLFPIEISLIITMIGSILITGALHEDGFADVCDGFGGGWNKKKILDIMKDSRIGAYGVIGLILLFLLKFYLLLQIIQELNSSLQYNNIHMLLLFISGHSLSRLSAISIVFTHQYARDDDESKSKPIAQGHSYKEVSGAFIFGLAPIIVTATWQYSILFVIPII
ncbi:MAG TPA: adenosylcobinamide-GDP ribazoletransferase, partial [Bacteroidia bacterium]|nr:adenosylcobinamide-GDP ribazoletransferase [Bacteroidia bacterium]